LCVKKSKAKRTGGELGESASWTKERVGTTKFQARIFLLNALVSSSSSQIFGGKESSTE